MDITILGSDSLRWARRLRATTAMVAAWSVIPAVLGGLVLFACLSATSQSEPSHTGVAMGVRADPAPIATVPERPGTRSVRMSVGQVVRVVHRPGWSLVSLRGTALRGQHGTYTAVRPGRAVLTAHNGHAQWRSTVAVSADPVGDSGQ